MKGLCTSLFLLLSTNVFLAQQIDLTGQISVHNSRYETGEIEYVPGAFIQAPFAGETSSDSEGLWGLTFQDIAGGTIIKLSVEKAGYEVVNSYDLERVVLGQKSRLPIYVTTKGRLAQAQTELYNISKTSLYARKDAIIARLQGEKAERDAALAELQENWNIEIKSVGEALELLDSKIADLEERLPGFAQKLAAKNLDFASDLYIEAYKLYQTGDIEEAITVLDDAKLEESYQKALLSIKEGQKLEMIGAELQKNGYLQIEQIVDSYKLKADGHNLLFEYRSAVAIHQKIVEILEARTDEETLELADAYGYLAISLRDLGSHMASLDAQKKATKIKEELLPIDDKELAGAYNNLALINKDVGDYESALSAQQKSLAILEQVLDAPDTLIAITYNNLGSIYESLGDYESALSAQQKSLAILEQAI